MNQTEILNDIGDKVSNYSAQGMEWISSKIGIDATNLQIKILALIILALIVYVASKISNKIAKVVIILLSIILIVSLLFSFS